MKVQITITPSPEYEDPDNFTGLTSEGFDVVMDALMGIAEDIDIRKEDD